MGLMTIAGFLLILGLIGMIPMFKESLLIVGIGMMFISTALVIFSTALLIL